MRELFQSIDVDISVPQTFLLVGKPEKKEQIVTDPIAPTRRTQFNLPDSFYQLSPQMQEEVMKRMIAQQIPQHTPQPRPRNMPVRRYQFTYEINLTDVFMQVGKIALLALIFTSNQGFKKWLALFLLLLSLNVIYKIFFEGGGEPVRQNVPQVNPQPVQQPERRQVNIQEEGQNENADRIPEDNVQENVEVPTAEPTGEPIGPKRSFIGNVGYVVYLFFVSLSPSYH
jgi:hypothetical protein